MNISEEQKNFEQKKKFAYIQLFSVLIIWGVAPLLTKELYKYYSPTIRNFFSEIVLIITYALLAGKNIKKISPQYFKIGIPTGFFLALANLSQKIGLMYTTPAKYAFLENLSCVKKKITLTTVTASVICLISAFILNGVSFGNSAWGKGEILCAISGLLYGFNIAGTGAFAKKLCTPVYLMVQSMVGMTVSFIVSIILNFTYIQQPSGAFEPVEKIMFSFKIEHILFCILLVVLSSGIGWVMRTNSMKYIDTSTVSVITPFSAVVTGIFSVLAGKDVLSINLVAGGILGMAAIIISELDSILKKKKQTNV